MNAIAYAVNRIKRAIPKEVLNFAYVDDYGELETIESMLESVIRQTVLVDTNIVAGRTVYLRLSEEMVIERDEFGHKVFTIPSTALAGNKILSVHSIIRDNTMSITSDNVSGRTYSSGSDLLNTSITLLNNISASSYIDVTASLSLIGNNTIHILEDIGTLDGLTLKLVVENQSLINNLNTRAFIKFSELCLLAVKSDIYNRTIIKMDTDKLVYGQSLGIIKSKIEEYADADQMYFEYLDDVWRKTTFFANDVDMNNYVKTLYPNSL
jgi:hypothetical protein